MSFRNYRLLPIFVLTQDGSFGVDWASGKFAAPGMWAAVLAAVCLLRQLRCKARSQPGGCTTPGGQTVKASKAVDTAPKMPAATPLNSKAVAPPVDTIASASAAERHPGFPDLPLDGYLAQPFFHQINSEFAGELQLPVCCTVVLHRRAAPSCCTVVCIVVPHRAGSCCTVALQRRAALLCCTDVCTVVLQNCCVLHCCVRRRAALFMCCTVVCCSGLGCAVGQWVTEWV